MSSAFNVFVDAIRKHSKKCLAQKMARFGSLRPIPMIQPPLDSSWVAWVEQFPSYTQLNIGAKIIILCINPVCNVLTIINKDRVHYRNMQGWLPWLLKLLEGFLEGLFGVLEQPAPMIIHVLPASTTVVEKIQHLTEARVSWITSPDNCTPSGTVLLSLALHTIWTFDTMYFLALYCSTDLVQSYECAFLSPVCVYGFGVRGGGSERGWVAVNS